MAQNSIPRWLGRCKQNTDAVVRGVSRGELDDSFGWGAMLEAMWKRSDRPSGLLLTGQAGCGKHMAQAHMLRLLMNDGYDVLIISDDVFEEGVRGAEVSEVLEQQLGRGKKLCIVLDQLTKVRDALVSCCGRMLASEGNALFVILLEETAGRIPSMLRDKLLRCHMNLPAAENRWAFMEGYLKRCFDLKLQDFVNEETMNAHTKGFTYAQLKDLTYNIGITLEMDASDGIDEYLVTFAQEQAGEPQNRDEGLLRAQLGDLVEQLPELLKIMQEEAAARSDRFADKLSEAIIQGGGIALQNASVGQSVAQSQRTAIDDKQFESNEKSRIESMAPDALYEELQTPLPELQ